MNRIRVFLIRLLAGKNTVILNAKLEGHNLYLTGDHAVLADSDFTGVMFYLGESSSSRCFQAGFYSDGSVVVR